MWPRPPVRGIKSIITIAGEEVHDALMGKKTLKEALETAQNRSEKLE
jgi:multiple sugar transport system substrate-binding protein